MISYNAEYWIWLSQALGYNNPKIKRINEIYSDVSDFYSGGESEWRYCGIFSDGELRKLKAVKLDNPKQIIKRCNELGYSVLSIDDEVFPSCLYNIEAPPAVLYISGTLPDVDNRLTIGIVGTRTATRYGTDNSYKIAYALSKYGVATVSGGALGVDCASHRGSLSADGVTVCVLGCGINCKYLSENARMRQAITKRGAVISEYPPDETPRSYYFPARNRIISALSDGLLVIEAGEKSGSLITARLAGEQGKKLFALLGNNSPENEGSNTLIKEGLAVPITDFMDILNEFDSLYATNGEPSLDNLSFDDIEAIPVKGKPRIKALNKEKSNETTHSKNENPPTPKKDNRPKAERIKNINLSETAKKVYEYIGETPVHIDKIADELKLPVFKVLTAVTVLEMNNLIEAQQGRRYILK